MSSKMASILLAQPHHKIPKQMQATNGNHLPFYAYVQIIASV